MIEAIDDLWFRLKLAFQVFLRASAYRPFVEFENFQIKNDTSLVLKRPLKIHCLENIELTSDRHIFIDSGRTFDPNTNTQYSIWFNTDRDELGNPIINDGGHN